MWKDKTVSVVLMTYAERDSIREVIEGFQELGVVDEVLVINNNAQEGTAEEVAKTGARSGLRVQAGIRARDSAGAARGNGRPGRPGGAGRDLPAGDLLKLLAYSDECDMVLGTRTTRELIWAGSNMDFFLKWGNWAVAKLVEVLFNTSHLSDVGCTYRLLDRRLVDYIEKNMRIGGSHAGPEIMLLTITSGARFVEIPSTTCLGSVGPPLRAVA